MNLLKESTNLTFAPWLPRVKLNKLPVYMYGLLMTLALTFFLSTEMEELLTLRQKVGSLERVECLGPGDWGLL